jgi:hypothetical protein
LQKTAVRHPLKLALAGIGGATGNADRCLTGIGRRSRQDACPKEISGT